METIQTLVGFARKGKGKHSDVGKFGASAFYASYTSAEDCDYDDDTIEPADAYQAHDDPVDPGSDDGEEPLDDDDDDEENDTFSSYVPLDDATVFEAAKFDAIALLADTQNDDLDPEVSAQWVQANVQADLSFGKKKGERQRQKQGQIPCSSITFVTGGSSTTAE